MAGLSIFLSQCYTRPPTPDFVDFLDSHTQKPVMALIIAPSKSEEGGMLASVHLYIYFCIS